MKNNFLNKQVLLRGTVSFCSNDNLQANLNAGLVESFTKSCKYVSSIKISNMTFKKMLTNIVFKVFVVSVMAIGLFFKKNLKTVILMPVLEKMLLKI